MLGLDPDRVDQHGGAAEERGASTEAEGGAVGGLNELQRARARIADIQGGLQRMEEDHQALRGGISNVQGILRNQYNTRTEGGESRVQADEGGESAGIRRFSDLNIRGGESGDEGDNISGLINSGGSGRTTHSSDITPPSDGLGGERGHGISGELLAF